jgi:Cft2 family RNA processing exonuclease
MIKDCMLKVTPCALEETVVIEPGFEIRPYYAGHVLGAAMFYVKVGQQSFVYTGDYNMTPDRCHPSPSLQIPNPQCQNPTSSKKISMVYP